MRVSLLLLFSLLAVAEGRRGSQASGVPVPKKRLILSQWGYPYGWGLDVLPMEQEPAKVDTEGETDKVKQVKRGTLLKADPLGLSSIPNLHGLGSVLLHLIFSNICILSLDAFSSQ